MPSRHLFIIRIALLTGVTAFAALVVYQRSRGMATLGDGTAMLDTMRYALFGLAGAALAAAFFLRSRTETATPATRGMMTVIGWAFGEGVALFGVVQHYLGAPVSTLAVGLMTFILVHILLPVPRDRS
jgi:FtsH-binding integral membrane protein